MQSTRVTARALSGSTWSALNEAVYAVGPVAESLHVSEIMYHPLDTGNPNDPNAEYVELTNIADQSINLNMVRFAEGINYTFPSFDLPAGGYCLVVKDVAAFQAKCGSKLPVVGQYTGSLDNAGEQVELVDAAGEIIQSFTYADNWFKSTDGRGFSLTVKDPKTTGRDSLSDKNAGAPAPPSMAHRASAIPGRPRRSGTAFRKFHDQGCRDCCASLAMTNSTRNVIASREAAARRVGGRKWAFRRICP